MGDAKSISISKLIIIPAVITLGVTILRLVGELAHWPTPWFSAVAGGGAAVVGISWLPIIFGPYFALKLAGAGDRPSSTGKSIAYAFAALVVYVLAGFLFTKTISHPSSPHRGGAPLDAGCGVCAVARLAFPRERVVRLRSGGADSGPDRDVLRHVRKWRRGLGNPLRRGATGPRPRTAGNEIPLRSDPAADDHVDRMDRRLGRDLRQRGCRRRTSGKTNGAGWCVSTPRRAFTSVGYRSDLQACRFRRSPDHAMNQSRLRTPDSGLGTFFIYAP